MIVVGAHLQQHHDDLCCWLPAPPVCPCAVPVDSMSGTKQGFVELVSQVMGSHRCPLYYF